MPDAVHVERVQPDFLVHADRPRFQGDVNERLARNICLAELFA